MFHSEFITQRAASGAAVMNTRDVVRRVLTALFLGVLDVFKAYLAERAAVRTLTFPPLHSAAKIRAFDSGRAADSWSGDLNRL